MSSGAAFGVALLLLTSASASVAAVASPIVISDAWIRPAPPGMVTAGYLTITNQGAADRLVAASSPMARSVSPHESRMAGGMMTMRPLRYLDIPARSVVSFAPAGMHLMIEGLKRPLRVGGAVPVVLSFARAGRLEVLFHVLSAPPP